MLCTVFVCHDSILCLVYEFVGILSHVDHLGGGILSCLYVLYNLFKENYIHTCIMMAPTSCLATDTSRTTCLNI